MNSADRPRPVGVHFGLCMALWTAGAAHCNMRTANSGRRSVSAALARGPSSTHSVNLTPSLLAAAELEASSCESKLI